MVYWLHCYGEVPNLLISATKLQSLLSTFSFGRKRIVAWGRQRSSKLSVVFFFHSVVELVRRPIPLALTPEDDPRREELQRLQERKEEIDRKAHRQVLLMLWSGLGVAVLQVGLFVRLTFWEFSWDVMEPIAFFTTATGLVIGYGYFMITSKDPTYQDLMKTLFISRQQKLFKKYQFDIDRFLELTDKCKNPLDKKQINEKLVL